MIFSKGLKNLFEAAVVNEPSVFEPSSTVLVVVMFCINVQKEESPEHIAA